MAVPWAHSTTVYATTTTLAVTDANGNALPTDSSGNLDIAIGQSIEVTATVSDGQGLVPQGSVTFKSNVSGSFVSYATVNLTATGTNTATASYTTTYSQGTYQLEAVYNGSLTQLLGTSTSSPVPVSVATTTAYNTGTTVSVNPSTINLNDSSTITATVTPGDPTAPAPTGTVTFSAAGSGTYSALIGQVSLVPDANDNSSTATITPTFGRADAYTIEADYAGVVYNGANNARIQFYKSSGTATLTVLSAPAKTPTITSLTPLPATIRSGSSVVLSAHVTQNGTPLASSDGEVRFYVASSSNTDNPIFAGEANLDDSGDASVTVPNTAYTSAWLPGTYVLTATYVGNTFYQASSGSATLTVNQARNSVTTVPSVHTYVGDPVTLSADVADSGSPTTPVTDGDLVGLKANDPNTTSCTAATLSGVASCTETFQNAGTWTLTGSYLGGPVYNPSSGVGTVVVDKVPTADSVTASPNPAPQGSTVTLSGHLTDTLHAGNPPIAGATVTLALDGNASETCTATTNASGDGSCAVTVGENPGTYPVSVSYAGDAKYQSSSNASTLQVVGPLKTSWTYLGDTSVVAGQQATIKFQLTDELGRALPNRAVTLTLPDGSTFATTTDANGYASTTVTPTTPDTYTPKAQFGDGSTADLAEPGYYASSGTGTLVVKTIPTQWTYVGDTSVNGGAQADISFRLTDKTNGQPLAGMPVTLKLIDGTTYSTTTDANGIASKTVTAPTPSQVTSYPVSAQFGGKLPYEAATDGTGTVTVTTIPTTIAYVGDTSVWAASPARIAFKLTDPSGSPLQGMSLTLTLPDGSHYTDTTDADGIVSTTVTAPGPSVATSYPVSASFDGKAQYLASTGPGALTVNPIPTVTTYTGPDHGNGGKTTVTATLAAQPTSTPLAGKLVTISVGGLTCVGTTDSAGVATCTIDIKLGSGAFQATASFAGSGYYLPSSGPGIYTIGNFKTGSSSIGFWRNNGQGVIKSSAATNGVCDLGTWLQKYAPFQDLSPTACSDVAAYVQTVLGAATGSTMNLQLKAQMLGVALDDYFSSPSLGGNQIGASWWFGFNTYDLTSISPDGDVSSAFGGATSLNLAAMLTYAASQSNVGGSVWYGNAKTLQTYAKDAFDDVIQGSASLR